MFLNAIVRRNPELVSAAVRLHQEGRIPANSYVIDLDAVRINANFLKDEAKRQGLQIYFMTKQYGRNPLVTRAAIDEGKPMTVAVDMDCVCAIARWGIPLGHVGNLVQIPKSEIPFVLDLRPEVISVFSIEKAKQISDVAAAKGMVQDILLRVVGPDDVFLPGMVGGFPLNEIADVACKISRMPGIRIVGVVTFPALFYTDAETPRPTPNLATIRQAASILERDVGISVWQINAPGNTCCVTMETFAREGATHVEPGHGLTGTTTFHISGEGPEIPAVVYVTEVSHFVDGKVFTFGGGFFVDDPPVPARETFQRVALVGDDPSKVFDRRMPFLGTGPDQASRFAGIDYHGILDPVGLKCRVGDTVVFGFRIQAFVARAKIAIVSGIQTGAPHVEGLYDRNANRLDVQGHPLQG